jgi:6,7-dimethyl-8-ribityllumazine synthase
MAEPRRDLSKQTLPALPGARFLIVEARFYDAIGALLRDGAQRAIAEGRASAEVISVPGALEIPVAIVMAVDAATAAGTPYDGVISLGCVIRGATYHFEIVAGESSRALIDLAVTRRLALGNGILTVENEAQALERADPAQGDKGGDAARAAIVLAALARRFGGAR